MREPTKFVDGTTWADEIFADSTIQGTAGNDVLTGTAGNDVVNGLAGDDDIDGGSGDDVLCGGAGADVIFGGYFGNDILRGGKGDDILAGSDGNDILDGGAGDDEYHFNEQLNSLTNVDRIKNFEVGHDRFWIDVESVFPLEIGDLKAENFRASAGGQALDGNDYILYDTDTGAVYFDSNGSGGGHRVKFAIIGAADGELTAHDFYIG